MKLRTVLDFTLTEYNALMKILSSEKEYEFSLDFYTDLIKLFSQSTIDEIEDLDFETHQDLSKKIMEELVILNSYTGLPSSTRVGATTYFSDATSGEYTFKIKTYKQIQSYLGKTDHIYNFAAIIFYKDSEGQTISTLEERATQFHDMLVKDIIGFVNKFITTVAK